MAVFKDVTRNTYYVKTYYIDYTGEKKQKKKRGFKQKKMLLIGNENFCYKCRENPIWP